MSDAEAVVEEPGVAPQPAAKPPRRVVQSRHRDRDFALRRALLLADMVGIFLALGLAMTVLGRRTPLGDLLWIVPTLPFWAVLFWSYRLYGRAVRGFEPTHFDDAPSLFHALVLGTLGLWLYYKIVPPVPRLNLDEVLVFGLLALPLIAGLRVLLRAHNLRVQGPERVFVIAPPEDVRLLGRKLDNHPEYEMELAAGGSRAEPARSLTWRLAPGWRRSRR